MKISNLEECVREYKSFDGWSEDYEQERQKLLKDFPYSIIVQGDHLELEMAERWCSENLGEKNESNNWTILWYSKINYDYSFWEFFFKNEVDAEKFKNVVPTFYAEPSVKKWRTDGYDKHIDL